MTCSNNQIKIELKEHCKHKFKEAARNVCNTVSFVARLGVGGYSGIKTWRVKQLDNKQ